MFRHGRVDQYLEKTDEWARPMLEKLRGIMLQSGLEETIKWGSPTYIGKKNVVSMLAFKNHVAIWFYQGALLSDPQGILIATKEGTQALRKVYFKRLEEIDTDTIAAYVEEARINDDQGKFVEKKKKPVPTLPADFKQALTNAGLIGFFEELAPSHRREHIMHVREAKKDATRERRIAKAIKLMNEKAGKGK